MPPTKQANILHICPLQTLWTHYTLCCDATPHRQQNPVWCPARFTQKQILRNSADCMMDDLAKGLDNRFQIDVVLLDYEAAFDKVSHRHPLKKVEHYGIRGRTLEWISDFLHSHTQSVLVDGQQSSESCVSSGVPQGSVLGPLLFLTYINDLPNCISSSTTRLFADGSVLYRQVSSPEDATSLQKDLLACPPSLGIDMLMRFNASKCQVVQVTNKRNPFPAKYTIHGQVLETVNSAKYLGVQLDSKLSFNNHVDAITRKANQTRAAFSRNLCRSSQKIKEAVYTTFIRPTVEFAASAWEPSTQRNSRKVEQVQRSAARFVIGDYRRTSSVTSMLDQLGWTSLQERRAPNPSSDDV